MGESVKSEQPVGRREAAKRLGAAILGAGVAAPLLGAQSAQAQGTQPAYCDSANVFTQPQQVPSIGVGCAPSAYPLQVASSQLGVAASISAYGNGLGIGHSVDWQGQCYDLVDLFHKSSGDAIFVAHQGGAPPGYTGAVGADSAFNVLIPYYLDDSGTGRNGSVVNNRGGMQGLFIQSQATQNAQPSIVVYHWSNGPAAYLKVQSPEYPQGTGGGIVVDDWSSQSSLSIGKWTAPSGNNAIVTLGSPGLSAAIPALRVSDSSGAARVLLRTDGTAAFGTTGSPFAVRLQAEMGSSGLARNLALTNSNGTQGSGVQIEFDDHSAQYGLLACAFDSLSPRNGSMRFSVRANDTMTERLRLDGTGIGFFGHTPAAQPVVSGSRAGNQALTSLLQGLASLGLLTNSTV